MPGAFDGLQYDVASDGDAARLTVGLLDDLGAASDLCADVEAIGYACAVKGADAGAPVSMADAASADAKPDGSADGAAESVPVSEPESTETTEVVVQPVGVRSLPVIAGFANVSAQADVLSMPPGAMADAAPDEHVETAGMPKGAEAATEEVAVLALPAGVTEPVSAEQGGATPPEGGLKGVPAGSEAMAPAEPSRPSSISGAATIISDTDRAGPPSGGWSIDLGVFETPADADLAWLRLQARQQTLFAGLNRHTETGEGGTRLIAGAVASQAQAREICNAIAANRPACSPKKF